MIGDNGNENAGQTAGGLGAQAIEAHGGAPAVAPVAAAATASSGFAVVTHPTLMPIISMLGPDVSCSLLRASRGHPGALRRAK